MPRSWARRSLTDGQGPVRPWVLKTRNLLQVASEERGMRARRPQKGFDGAEEFQRQKERGRVGAGLAQQYSSPGRRITVARHCQQRIESLELESYSFNRPRNPRVRSIRDHRMRGTNRQLNTLTSRGSSRVQGPRMQRSRRQHSRSRSRMQCILLSPPST